jgi:hypothetical protein
MMFRAATLNNNSTFEVCRTPPLLKQHETAIVDSGCTGHFLLINAPRLSKVKSRTPLTVRLPNGATMESYHTVDLEISKLNDAASKAHVVPGMANHSLLSVGKLCDECYIVTFKQDTVTICDSGNSHILSGPRDLDTILWRINLRQTNNHKPKPIANNVYELRNTRSLSPLLAQSLIQSDKICNVSSGQRRTSDHLARLDGRRYQQTFETDACYGHGTFEPAAPKHTINLEGAH